MYIKKQIFWKIEHNTKFSFRKCKIYKKPSVHIKSKRKQTIILIIYTNSDTRIICPSPRRRQRFFISLHRSPTSFCWRADSIHIFCSPWEFCKPGLDGLRANSGMDRTWRVNCGANYWRVIREVGWILITAQKTKFVTLHRNRRVGLCSRHYCSVIRYWECWWKRQQLIYS